MRQEEGAPGVDLVPSTAPSDPFGDDDGDNGNAPRKLSSIRPSDGSAGFGVWAAYPQSGDVPSEVVDAAVAAAGPSVRLSLASPRPDVEVGAEVVVAVRAHADAAVSHLPITLRFDPGRLEVVAVNRGDFLGPTGVASVLSNTERPGHAVLAPSRLGQRPGVTGEGEVARIRFRALREGVARIRFADAAALDRDLGELAVARSGLELNVVPVGTLPPPEREVERPAVDRPDRD